MRPLTPFLDRFLCDDACTVMQSLPAQSVDLIVTSPPYNLRRSTGHGLRDGRASKWPQAALRQGYTQYSDDMPEVDYIKWQRDCLTQMMRVLKEDGALFYNHKWRVQGGLLQDRQSIVSGFPVRQVIIWQRKGGINFNPGYFLPTYEVIYLIAKPAFVLCPKANRHGDVWSFRQASANPHPAPFPLALVERMIESTAAGIILDPFMGSGTTALAAKKLGRFFIGIDQAPEYCAMAEQRLARAGF